MAAGEPEPLVSPFLALSALMRATHQRRNTQRERERERERDGRTRANINMHIRSSYEFMRLVHQSSDIFTGCQAKMSLTLEFLRAQIPQRQYILYCRYFLGKSDLTITQICIRKL
jgi:hypothetical protein